MAEPSIEELRSAVQLACQPQNGWRIVSGREQVLAMPREWVLGCIERVATESLDLADSWEYRRLLELIKLLDDDLTQRVATLGLNSADPDVREAAEDFQSKPLPE
jgi:hypothetical protein